MPEERKKKDHWQKGKAFDLWSIPHFLFGILMAFTPELIGISLRTGLALTVILAMLWEVYEKFIDIKETPQNILLDVLLPISAYSLTSYMLFIFPLPYEQHVLFATAVLILYLYTNISGWLAFRNRNRNFMS